MALFTSLLGRGHDRSLGHAQPCSPPPSGLWAGLCFTTAFLGFGGWLANQSLVAPARCDEARPGVVARWVVALIGLLALAQGIVMFLAPTQVSSIGHGRSLR